jgi:hypothetical protein
MSIPRSPSSLTLDQAADVDGLRHQMEPLLRHYKERVLDPAAQLRKWRRSPWQMLFWPCALETWGEIQLWNTAPHARSAVLHAILANSAFHLHATEQSDGKWRDFGLKYQNKAKNFLFQALQGEILGVAQPKYKELLMAILSVAMTSVGRPEPVFIQKMLTRASYLPNPKHSKDTCWPRNTSFVTAACVSSIQSKLGPSSTCILTCGS